MACAQVTFHLYSESQNNYHNKVISSRKKNWAQVGFHTVLMLFLFPGPLLLLACARGHRVFSFLQYQGNLGCGVFNERLAVDQVYCDVRKLQKVDCRKTTIRCHQKTDLFSALCRSLNCDRCSRDTTKPQHFCWLASSELCGDFKFLQVRLNSNRVEMTRTKQKKDFLIFESDKLLLL